MFEVGSKGMMRSIKTMIPSGKLGMKNRDRMNILTQGRKWKNRDRIEYQRKRKRR